MSEPTGTSEGQTRLNEVIAEYFAAVEAGNPPDRERFIEQHGPLAAELREFFRNGEMFDQMARTLSIAPGAARAAAQVAGQRIRYFGDYELAEELARGGMGIVFKARQISLNRLVALKMILSGQFASSAEVLRFRSEAESAAALDHPNIVPIYEVGDHQGQHYFTMKLIDGGNIEQWARSHSPTQRQIAAMMATIARAVHFGHQRGILHRDLKPGNVLVDSANVAYVVDFGIAKRVETDQGLTRTTDVLGSPAYMSPEQAAGKAREISVATDVYGLGAILYSLLSGRPPFVAESAAETLRLVLEADPPRPSAAHRGIDADLQTICLKCIEKDPARRYPSAQAIAEDLRRWLDGKPIVARPVSRIERAVKWARRRPSLAALVAVSIVLLGVLVWVLPIRYVQLRRALEEEAKARHREAIAMQENRDRLVQTSVTRGLEAMAVDDHGAALIWFAHALRDETDPQRQRVLRMRITLGLAQMPRMRQLLTGDTPLCFSDDGKTLVSLGGSKSMGESGASRFFQGSTLTAHDLSHPRKLSQPLPATPPTGVINSLQGALARLVSRGTTPAPSAATSGEPTANVGKGEVHTEVTTPVTRLAQTTTVPGGTVLTFWDVPKLKALGSTSAQLNPPRHIGYSADGSRAVVVSQGPASGGATRETIDCFDVNTGAAVGPPISMIRGTNDPEIWLQINAAGDRVATVSKVEHPDKSDGSLTATVWDIATAKAVFNAPVGPKRNLNPSFGGQAIFSADSSRLLTLYFSAMRTWDLRSGKPLSDEQFTNVDVDPGPAFIAPAGGFIGNETVWINQTTTIGFRLAEGGQPQSGSDLATGGRLEDVACSPDGRMFASVARVKSGHAVRLWGADYRHLLASQIICADGTLPRVLFTPDSKRVVIASNWYPVTTQVRDATPPAEQSSYPRLFKRTGWERALSPDGHRALSQVQAPQDGSLYNLRITDLQTGKSIEFLSPVGNVEHASFSPDGSRIVVAGEFRTGPCAVSVLRGDDGRAVVNPFYPLPEETSDCYFVGFTSDGQWIVIEYGKRNENWQLNYRQVWSALNGAKFEPGGTHAGQDVVSFSEDSHRVLLANHPRGYQYGNGNVRVWDLAAGKAVSGALPQGVDCARFSPDSRFVLLYGCKKSGDRPLTLYEVASGREVWSVKTDCTHLAFSPDGSKIAVASASATEVRSASDGSLLSRPINRGVAYNDFDPMGSMTFSADGLLLIFASTRNSGLGAQIFDARTGEIVVTVAMEESWQSIAAPVFPAGDRMLLVHDNRPVEISFAPDGRDADRLEMLIHLLSGRKLDANGSLAPLSADEIATSWDALIASGEPEVGEAATGR